MPTFDFTAPDGKGYSVDGPEGSTPEQAFQILQQSLGAPAPSSGSSLGGVAKSLGVGLAQGAIGLAGIPADLAHLYATNKNDPNPLGSEGLQKAIESRTGEFYKPQGAIEETAAKIGQFTPAVIGGPEALGTKLATRVVAPAVASEAAGKLTEGTAAQPYAELAGALAGGAVAPGAVRKLSTLAQRGADDIIPTGEGLLRKASSQFNEARDMNVVVKPDFAKDAAKDMRAAIKDYDPNVVKDVHAAANRLESLGSPATPQLSPAQRLQAEMNWEPFPSAKLTPVNMNDAENVRKQLVSLKTSPDASVRSAAKAAIESLQQSQMALTPAHTLSGDAGAYRNLVSDAVGNWAAGKRSNAVTGKMDLAALNSGTAGSGANQDNNLRQAVKQLARPMNNTNVPVAKKLGFNNSEIDAIKQAATGTRVGNIARYIGKGAPTGIVSAAGGLGVGHMAGGPLGAVAVPAVGYLAKKIGDLSTKNAVAAIDKLVRSRSPLAASVAAQLPPAFVQQLPTRTQRLLQFTIMSDAALRNRSQQRDPVGQSGP